jgi:hypothetical protein
MTVLFHGNFGLNRPRLARLLGRALESPELSDADLAKPEGYGAPYAAKYRSWLHKLGLAHLGLPLELTSLGEVVIEHDPTLDLPLTLEVLHHQLTDDPDRAEAWHYFIHEFLPGRRAFTREELLVGLTDKLRAHSEMHFGPGSKLNPIICRKLIEAYSSKEGLGPLGVIEPDGNAFIARRTGVPPTPSDDRGLRAKYRRAERLTSIRSLTG